jgi:cytochrome c-type biogenesis protein CcmH
LSWRLVAIFAIFLLQATPALAVDPDEMLKDPKLEARAEQLGRQLRCPVCKTESIEESDADFTKDLRRVVRERVAAGDSDSQVLSYMHDRYGDFILLRPPFQPSTWALWLAPPVILLLASGIAFGRSRARRATADSAPLTQTEKAALEALK